MLFDYYTDHGWFVSKKVKPGSSELPASFSVNYNGPKTWSSNHTFMLHSLHIREYLLRMIVLNFD